MPGNPPWFPVRWQEEIELTPEALVPAEPLQTPTGAVNPGEERDQVAERETKVDPKPADKPETPAAPAAQAQPPAPVLPLPAPKPVADPDAEPEHDPKWLGRRLDQQKRALLKELGVESPEEIKRVLAEHRTKTDAEKSEVQRLTEKAAVIPTLQKERDALADELGAIAKQQMRDLTADQRSAVKSIAGDDPTKQLQTIRALTPTWGASRPVDAPAAPPAAQEPAAPPKPAEAAPPAPQQPAPAAPANPVAPALPVRRVVPPPANSAPLPGAPAGAPPPAATDHLAIMNALDERNPVKAAAYYDRHKYEIDAARAAIRNKDANAA